MNPSNWHKVVLTCLILLAPIQASSTATQAAPSSDQFNLGQANKRFDALSLKLSTEKAHGLPNTIH